MSTTIYHNPRCSKSRQTLELLKEQGIEPTIIEYLKTPPDYATLDKLLQQLGLEPHQLMRTGEAEYKELKLAAETLSRQELIKIMVDHPKLIERPIVVSGKRAALGRPPTKVLEIL
ncbi:MAG TPA: arsenate reductase (glutaredoxin) [Gammaproteobacteria bacterium]|nr:arsenate reductase (glutaredoxin) [Gammaproteobacteria bacterium]